MGSTKVCWSKSGVRKLGSKLRKHAAGELTAEEFEDVKERIDKYRKSFNPLLSSVYEHLHLVAENMPFSIEITRRLKRMETIVGKLVERETGADLSRLQDIAGCRMVVLGGLPELYRLREEVCRAWDGRVWKLDDYVTNPRLSGYRAVHVIVKSADSFGFERLVEIQLRTVLMHVWANLVERVTEVAGCNYKQDGAGGVYEHFRELSDIFWRAENEGVELEIFSDELTLVMGSILKYAVPATRRQGGR
ncbi:RelA/SpoT domain-containing protein [Buchananella hordeovulneris]|uniref:RelA/SpoT domain-containing protein n=1 Tax=Buchananella hordeovulneris TaxID=52770 RepID=UPI000F601A17|nr:RelA/SpoT domain-containing protein [Buchananella hordeovulneris]MDO5080198.1 RelA/SpoT domain-containing protein [Buchananella hordeovulneris]RRD43869.1 hypothetical protein EII13_06245 [Buchananella hordeovulneris]